MKKLLLIAVFALIGAALATEPTPNSNQSWAVNSDDSDSVSLSETINLTIPVRYALHLTETVWNLDLSNVPPGSEDGYTFNPNEPVPPEEGCYLVPKAVTSIDGLRDYALTGGIDGTPGLFRPIDTYPAIHDYNGDEQISDDEKGTLICVNHKVLQKFSNDPDGWHLLVSVTGPATGFGYFGMADVLPFGPGGYFYTNALPVTDQEIARMEGETTHGWLDDDIVEAFWFDGTEAAGNYTMTVTFTLAGL